MKKSLFLFSLAFLPLLIFSQDESMFGIKFNGFIKTDIIWDSRQTVDIREGHFLLYPKPESLDPDGNDINARASFNFLSIQTRLRGDIKGPDALGAKTSGAIEGEFFGMADSDINGFRLRHAYVKLNWKTTELMVGQFWHPMFITSCYPDVVSFNTGAPFLVFSRNPQIRLTQNIKGFRVILAALSQIDFKSTGPDGPSTKYIRNSAIPSLSLNLEYSKKNAEQGKEFLIGVAGNYKRLIPMIKSDSGYKTTEGINSMSGMVYIKLGFPKVVIKAAGLYGQNMYDYTMLGGYAVKKYIDQAKGIVSYQNITTMSVWTEIMTTGKKMMGGIFLGYSNNAGAGTVVSGPYYSRGKDVNGKGFPDDDISYLYRIAPRFIYNAGKFRLAPEIEYTVAGYGTTSDMDGKVSDVKPVGNFRFLLGVYYFF
ncbi:MAG: hypothetical protein M0Q51_02980 [Bacteroidales bacterium]|nr:hypothetical protein [Bacteroidales bacterium]